MGGQPCVLSEAIADTKHEGHWIDGGVDGTHGGVHVGIDIHDPGGGVDEPAIIDRHVQTDLTGHAPGGVHAYVGAIQRAAAGRFIGTGLELGGCDPAYVRHDANLAHAIENLVDGAYFNSGQSCCGIQRVYVHEHLYDAFVAGWADLVEVEEPEAVRDELALLGTALTVTYGSAASSAVDSPGTPARRSGLD